MRREVLVLVAVLCLFVSLHIFLKPHTFYDIKRGEALVQRYGEQNAEIALSPIKDEARQIYQGIKKFIGGIASSVRGSPENLVNAAKHLATQIERPALKPQLLKPPSPYISLFTCSREPYPIQHTFAGSPATIGWYAQAPSYAKVYIRWVDQYDAPHQICGVAVTQQGFCDWEAPDDPGLVKIEAVVMDIDKQIAYDSCSIMIINR